jgi:hypothetical protein
MILRILQLIIKKDEIKVVPMRMGSNNLKRIILILITSRLFKNPYTVHMIINNWKNIKNTLVQYP